MKKSLTICLVAALGMFGIAGCDRLGKTPRNPDVLILMVDSLRADGLGCYGNDRDTSPYLDSLAGQGVRFESAFAHTSHTKVSIASLFSGMIPPSNGIRAVCFRNEPWGTSDQTLNQKIVTVAETFRSHGYATKGIIANPYVPARFGFDQGFDNYDYIGGSDPPKATAQVANKLALEWLESRRDDSRPRFVYIHYMDVHYPYAPPEEYKQGFTRGMKEYQANYDNSPYFGEEPMTDERVNYSKSVYLAQIRYWDDELKKFMAALKKGGFLENTVVVVVADHGEEFYEHGGFGHGHNVYDESIRIPLIVFWPGVLPAGKTRTDMARLIDLYPTLAGFAKIDVSDLPIEGRRLFEDDPRKDPVVSKMEDQPLLYAETFRFTLPRCVRTLNTKLVYKYNARQLEFYHLDQDPIEQHNRYHPKDPEMTRLKKQLMRLSGLKPVYGAQDETPPVPPAAAEIQALRSIGYVGN